MTAAADAHAWPAVLRGGDPEPDLQRFRDYRSSGDRLIRNELVEAYHGLAMALARRFASRGEHLDDLVQIAQIGLLKAVERFDPERGVPFRGFATPTINGELRRHFRDSTWTVRVPRGLEESHLRLSPAVGELRQTLGRSPNVAEVAEHLGVDQESVLQAMEVSASYRPLSIHDGGPRGGSDLAQRLSARETGYGSIESKETVEALLATLSVRSRRILELRFFDDLSQAEIAARIGISQMHVSRLLRQALQQLGSTLGDAGLDDH